MDMATLIVVVRVRTADAADVSPVRTADVAEAATTLLGLNDWSHMSSLRT